MKKLYSMYLAVCLFGITQAQVLTNHQLLVSYTTTQVDSFLTAQGIPTFLVPITNGLDVYKLTYNTVSYDGSPTFATGTVFFPTNPTCAVPLISYNHGTMLRKADAPSNQVGEYVVGIALGADGYAFTLPDYLGLGDGPGLHPYVHAESEATSTIDMMRAARELAQQLNYPLNEQVFLTGYSQGGHAAMATHKYIQENNLLGEFKITASAPMSGPYDISGVQAQVITLDSSYGSPGYLPFVIFSYNMVYNMYPSYSQIFKEPYDSILPLLFDGSVGLGTVENFIPDTPNAIIIPELLDTFRNDPNHIFNQVLRMNDVYQWTPQAPVRMLYCESDELVSYRNALVAYDTMTARGAINIEKVSASTSQTHSDCALYTIFNAKFYFDGYREDRYDINVQTTPTTPGQSTGQAIATPQGGFGPYSFNWSFGGSDSIETNLSNGNYTLTVTDRFGCTSTQNFTIGFVGVEGFENTSFQVYPNPATDQFTIQASTPLNGKVDAEIFDMTGKMVHKSIFHNSPFMSFSTIGLSEGMYMVRLTSAEGRFITKVVVKR